MTLDTFTIGIFAGGVLTGISFAVLASMVPDLRQVITDFSERYSRLPDDPRTLALERAISRRFYRHLASLGAIVVLAAVTTLFLL